MQCGILMKIQIPQVNNGLLIAFSGGADSVSLLCLLVEMPEIPRLVAAHCNFHLRGGESDRDEDFVRNLCAEKGVELHVKHFDTHAEAQKSGESLEMTARRLRYEWFAQLLDNQQLDYVCTAHHRDDQIETVLLNLVRGTGLKGLRGMLPVQGRILRPLLHVSREEIRDFLAQKGQNFVEDSSNADTHFQRNFVRHEVLPMLKKLNSQAEKHIFEAAEHLREVEQRLENQEEDWSQRHCVILPDGVKIDFNPHERVGAIHENSEWTVCRTATGIEVRKNTEMPELNVEEVTSVDDVKNTDFAFVDADKIKGNLRLRHVENGDRFTPFGMTGTKLVSDWLTDRHCSRIDKMKQLVVCDDDGIVWLVRKTIADRCKIDEKSKKILKISLK